MSKTVEKFKSTLANDIYNELLELIGYEDLEMLSLAHGLDQQIILRNMSATKVYDYLLLKSKENKEIKLGKEIIQERAIFSANGHDFKIKPITLGEEFEFQSEFKINLIPHDNMSDEDIINLMMAMFNNVEMKNGDFAKIKALKKIPLRTILWKKITRKPISYDYEYYKGCHAYSLVKWLEKKITINGKQIHFYDIENVYGLNKLEIYDMICKFMELSNFPKHLQKRNQKKAK